MSISAVVPFAEMLTLALVIGLFVRIYLLYRSGMSAGQNGPSPDPAPEPREPEAPDPVSSEVAMASYIDELLLGLDDDTPQVVAAPPEKLLPPIGKPPVAKPRTRPATPSNAQTYQPIAVFLTSRYDAGST